MKLLSPDRPELLELLAGWPARNRNHRRLDFGNSRLPITPVLPSAGPSLDGGDAVEIRQVTWDFTVNLV